MVKDFYFPDYHSFSFLRIFRINFYLSRISVYSTVDVSNGVIFIGGLYTKNVVAKFQEKKWIRLPDLQKGRYAQASIQIEQQTFVIGGYGRLVIGIEFFFFFAIKFKNLPHSKHFLS